MLTSLQQEVDEVHFTNLRAIGCGTGAWAWLEAPPPASLLAPGCRDTRQPHGPSPPHPDERETLHLLLLLLRSSGSAEDSTERAELGGDPEKEEEEQVNEEEEEEEEQEERLAYLCSLLVQTLPQVSNALVHHRHLNVPSV